MRSARHRYVREKSINRKIPTGSRQGGRQTGDRISIHITLHVLCPVLPSCDRIHGVLSLRVHREVYPSTPRMFIGSSQNDAVINELQGELSQRFKETRDKNEERFKEQEERLVNHFLKQVLRYVYVCK